MCDVCDSTLFNFHWACSKCGFVVCVNCYRMRKCKEPRECGQSEKDRDEYGWLLCTTRQQHDLENLVMVQIIAADAMEDVADLMKERQAQNGFGQLNGNGVKKEEQDPEDTKVELKHYVGEGVGERWLGPGAVGHNVDAKAWTDIEHSWLDKGRVLRLVENKSMDRSSTLDLFRSVWVKGGPVVVSRGDVKFDDNLWNPKYFMDNFGDVHADYQDVVTKKTIANESLAKFWRCFISPSEKKDPNVTLLVKDWPPNYEEFNEALPSHFSDFFKKLPMSEYTSKTGSKNLVTSLPEVFVRPELGPKACITQGLGLLSKAHATTNLFMELADSVSVVIKAVIAEPQADELLELLETNFGLEEESKRRIVQNREILACIWHVFHPKDADKIRDLLNRERFQDEDGEKETQHKFFDPIHEADKALDDRLLDILKKDYGVTPYIVPQFVGESVFFPAGAPRQVHLTEF